MIRIHMRVREGALEGSTDRPGAKHKAAPLEDYEALKRDLKEKERTPTDQAVNLKILPRKKKLAFL